MIALNNQASSGQRAIHILTLPIDCGIDLMGHTVVALIPLKSDVMRSCNAPQRTSIHFVGGLPNSEMIPRHGNSNRFGVSESIILSPAKEKQCAHGHRSEEHTSEL